MGEQVDQASFPGHDSGKRERSHTEQKRVARHIWIAVALVTALSVMLSLGAVLLETVSSNQQLRADANTLYLADWSKDLDGWTGGAQWHWQERGVISSKDNPAVPSNPFVPHLLAPYRSSEANIQVDAQIKVLGYSFRDETIFGILVGSDSLGTGYACGLNWGRAIQLWPEDLAAGLTGFTTGDAGGDFSDYVPLTVMIRNQVITLLIDGQLAARATAPGYQAGGYVGLYAENGAVEVRGFRVEKLG